MKFRGPQARITLLENLPTSRLLVTYRILVSALAKITGQYPGSCLVRDYIFFQLYFSSGGGAPLPAMILAVEASSGTPARYDPLCRSFRCAGQACHRLGRRLRQDHLTPMRCPSREIQVDPRIDEH